MLTVHHLNQSRSHRVIWALEELGLPYEIVHYQRFGEALRIAQDHLNSRNFYAFNPGFDRCDSCET